jgi:uncharacterized protein (DUF1800 family)
VNRILSGCRFVTRHSHSLRVRTRAVFAAILLLSGLPQALISDPLVRADSRAVEIAGDSQNQAEAAPPQPLDPAFKGKLPISDLTENEAILHALNRLSYGPRPGDLERVKSMGLENWIERQLHPEKIAEPVLQARLAQLPAANLNSQTLLAAYPQPDVAAKRLGISVEEYRKQMDAEAHPPQGVRPKPSKLPQEALSQLQQAKALRAIYSERQLQEQLTDFWFNHFNVFANKDLDLWLLASYEHDVIRPRVLGRFRDLLGATAKSPAMLFYLDNYLSADPQAAQRLKTHPEKLRGRQNAELPPVGKRGLNENYGRELMELHTLGVDGGYTQQDVIEVARCFTGWTIRNARTKPEFSFDGRVHDPQPKRVLGKKIHAGGIRDGEQVLDLLARDPHTAHHIALELAQHFVSDNPPGPLVDKMALAFRKSGGDLREVMRAMIYSPEFWSRAAYRAKIKTPFELVVSAARALGADVDTALPLVNWVTRIGEPLYQCLPPTGYSDKASAWVNAGALLNRLNFALALAGNRVAGSQVQIAPLLGTEAEADPYKALEGAVNLFLAGQISASTRSTLVRQSADPQIVQIKSGATTQVNLGAITGLVLGAPEFQQR